MNIGAPKLAMGGRENLLVLAASWFLFGSLFQIVRPPQGVFLAWVALASMFSIASLRVAGYFDRCAPRPELSGVISLFLALPLSALFSKWLLSEVLLVPPIRSSEALRASVWVALTLEASQWAIFEAYRALGRQKTLRAYLPSKDLAALREEMAGSESSRWIDIRPAPADHGLGGLNAGETLVISRTAACDLQNHPEFVTAHLRGQQIVDAEQLLKEIRGRVDVRGADAWGFLLGSTYQSAPIRSYFHLKTFLEPVAAAALLLVFSPIWLALALAIRLTDGSPVLFRQRRVGYQGKTFSLYKFRTMAQTAESSGPQWARENDPRATPLGLRLRKTRLDEIPQLFNVLRGELSFVGPRPERPEFHKILSEQIPLFNLRLSVRPGITGWAQVRQGYAASVEECERKLEYDLYYIQNMSPWLDLRVVINTLAIMLRGDSGR